MNGHMFGMRSEVIVGNASVADPIVTEKLPGADAPLASVTCAVNANVPAAEGTPAKVPALLTNVPGGNVPAITVQE